MPCFFEQGIVMSGVERACDQTCALARLRRHGARRQRLRHR